MNLSRARMSLLLVPTLLVTACGGAGTKSAGGSTTPLVGLFRVDPGRCEANGASGSTFRMVQPNGTVAGGPFVSNGDSPCPDKTWTAVSPGTDGGLRTGVYQPQPAPAFAANGDAAAAAILAPQKFFAVRFGPSSNAKDPQTGVGVAAPSISVSGSTLTGDLRAFSVAWNGQQFNQGAPKPDGGRPGATSPVSGTYDPATKAFSITWSSQIVGGPFNNFTGTWTLQGRFQPA